MQLASGSKVQSEVDLIAGPGILLRIGRTYRSFRRNWKAQAAGTAWSFSFDRDFTIVGGGGGTAPVVAGVFGDGSSYTFEPRSGQFVSLYDKRLSLKALSSAYDDWILTKIDGQVERYKKINGVFRMVSAHRPDGESAVFSYDGDNQLVLISDAHGRSVKIVWHQGVDSIEGPSGIVRYEYQRATVPGEAERPRNSVGDYAIPSHSKSRELAPMPKLIRATTTPGARIRGRELQIVARLVFVIGFFAAASTGTSARRSFCRQGGGCPHNPNSRLDGEMTTQRGMRLCAETSMAMRSRTNRCC